MAGRNIGGLRCLLAHIRVIFSYFWHIINPLLDTLTPMMYTIKRKVKRKEVPHGFFLVY